MLTQTQRIGHIFCGGGGGTLASTNTLWAIDNDPQVLDVHRAVCPNILTILADVSKMSDFKIRHLEPIDILLAGSPCQELSKANTSNHARNLNRLILEVGRWAEILRPTAVILENVPQIIKCQEYKDLLISMSHLRYNFIQTTPNSLLYVPQKRVRLYTIFFKTQIRKPVTKIYTSKHLRDCYPDRILTAKYFGELRKYQVYAPTILTNHNRYKWLLPSGELLPFQTSDMARLQGWSDFLPSGFDFDSKPKRCWQRAIGNSMIPGLVKDLLARVVV